MTSLACPPTTTSVIELIAEATTRMTTLWDEIGTSQSDRDSVSSSLKKKLAECVEEVEKNETLIRDGKLSEIKQSCELYSTKATMLQKTTTTIQEQQDNENLTDAELRTRESLSLITEEFDEAMQVHEDLLSTLHALYTTLEGTEPYPTSFQTVGQYLSVSVPLLGSFVVFCDTV